MKTTCNGNQIAIINKKEKEKNERNDCFLRESPIISEKRNSTATTKEVFQL